MKDTLPAIKNTISDVVNFSIPLVESVQHIDLFHEDLPDSVGISEHADLLYDNLKSTRTRHGVLSELIEYQRKHLPKLHSDLKKIYKNINIPKEFSMFIDNVDQVNEAYKDSSLDLLLDNISNYDKLNKDLCGEIRSADSKQLSYETVKENLKDIRSNTNGQSLEFYNYLTNTESNGIFVKDYFTKIVDANAIRNRVNTDINLTYGIEFVKSGLVAVGIGSMMAFESNISEAVSGMIDLSKNSGIAVVGGPMIGFLEAAIGARLYKKIQNLKLFRYSGN